MTTTTNTKPGSIVFKMTDTMAKELLKTRKGEELKMNPNDFLCKVVNENFGIKSNCVKVVHY